MTAAYLRILIHTMNNSLFPDADPNSTTWTGPPPAIIAVQSLLYASLATSLFSAFLAMLGKQWVNRYLRNHGGSAADKSRDRQRKLDGLQQWHFHLAIESLPVMLQLALLLLGCALSHYLWMISRPVAAVVVTVTLFGVTSYVFLILAATLHYNCPYQTPPSILARVLINYVAHGSDTFAHLLRYLVAPFPSLKNLARILTRLRAGVRRALEGSGCTPVTPEETEHIPLAVVALPSPAGVFENISVDWEVCEADVRCISWVLSTSTDSDVIYSTARFAADVIWYPEIAGALSPHVLADLFFDCLLDGQVVPGKSEHANSIGMALASVLSARLATEPDNQALGELCGRIRDLFGLAPFESAPSSEQMFMLVVATLVSVAHIPAHVPYSQSTHLWFFESIPDNLSTTQKLWLSRIVLQTLWRWRRVQESTIVLGLHAIGSICHTFTTDDEQIPTIIKTNCFLSMAICLGLRIDLRDLYVPNNRSVLPLPYTSCLLIDQVAMR